MAQVRPRTSGRGGADGDPPAWAPMRSYTVLGTGAVGGFYGAKLAAAGHPVRFLGRGDVPILRAEGLRVTSADDELVVERVEAYEDPAEVPASDVILVAVKATMPNPAIATLARLDGGATAVISLQNGLGVEADLEEAADGRPLAGGLCFIAANRTAPGRVEHLVGGTVTLAPHGPDASEAVEAVAADLLDAGVEATTIDDLVGARWRKLVWNLPFNSLTTLLGRTPTELLANPDGSALVRTVIDEVVAAAEALGHPISHGYVDGLLSITRLFPPYRTSMGLDVAAGRPTEVEVIVGRPVTEGMAAGAPMPVSHTLLRQLRTLTTPLDAAAHR
jgi:2-dehydropantoate 2-reductase